MSFRLLLQKNETRDGELVACQLFQQRCLIVVWGRLLLLLLLLLCGSSTGEDPLFWEISIFQYILIEKNEKIFEILKNWKFCCKTALPAFLQKLYIYSIMSIWSTLAISNFFSKKNTSKHFCSNILHIIYIIFFNFFCRWKTSTEFSYFGLLLCGSYTDDFANI